ncbi:MAG: ArsR/SmtB family transcription factor [Polynucleobacter sp.]|jgi:ArsR family transcriptional regulator
MDMPIAQMNEAMPKLDISLMRANADNACRMMKTLANRDRLMLLCQLSQGEKRVGELEEATNIQQPTLSQQLAVLREENVVSTRRDGKHIYYKISSPIAMSVMELLYATYCGK